jgi:hypothetical protein
MSSRSSYDLRERGQAAILRDVTPTANMQSRTRGKSRTIAIHTCEAARQKAEEVAKTPEFAVALCKRRKVEALFSELKNLVGLRRLRLRRIKFVREQFYLAAVAQNLKRLVRFLDRRTQRAIARRDLKSASSRVRLVEVGES